MATYFAQAPQLHHTLMHPDDERYVRRALDKVVRAGGNKSEVAAQLRAGLDSTATVEHVRKAYEAAEQVHTN